MFYKILLAFYTKRERNTIGKFLPFRDVSVCPQKTGKINVAQLTVQHMRSKLFERCGISTTVERSVIKTREEILHPHHETTWLLGTLRDVLAGLRHHKSWVVGNDSFRTLLRSYRKGFPFLVQVVSTAFVQRSGTARSRLHRLYIINRLHYQLRSRLHYLLVVLEPLVLHDFFF